MDRIYLSIAGFTIEIRLKQTQWPFFTERRFADSIIYQYSGFIIKKKPKKIDYVIEVKHATNLEVLIQTNKKRYYIHFYEEMSPKTILIYYHISSMQLQLIIRKIIQKLLAKKHGMIFHASASLIKKSAYVFLGASGAGKTTATQLLATKYPPLADDSIIITKEKSIFYFYQTPFPEQSFWIEKKSKGYPLGKIFFLEKASFHKIEKMQNKDEITERFLSQFLTEEEDAKIQMPYLLGLLAQFDHFYKLFFSLQNANEMVKLMGQ